MLHSAKRHTVIRTLLIIIAACIGLLALWFNLSSNQQALRLHGHTYHIKVVKSPDELQKGLSGTANLPNDQAMLFVFSAEGTQAMWMKDMNFPIDMVWLNNGGEVVYLVKDVQPSSYPAVKFVNDKPARYVIELANGTIERTGVRIGDLVGLPSGI